MTEVDGDIVRVKHAVDLAAHPTSNTDHKTIYANVIRELRDDLAVLPAKDSARVLSAAITSMIQDGLMYLPSSFDFDASKVKATVDEDQIKLTDKSGKVTITISDGAITPSMYDVEKLTLHKKHIKGIETVTAGAREIRNLRNAAKGAIVNLPDLTVESHVPLATIAEDLLHRHGVAKPTSAQIQHQVDAIQKKDK